MTTRTILMCAALAACGDPGGDNGNEEEVITTVTLTFTPSAGSALVATFDDPDGDGGNAPTIDPVNLAAAATYTLTVAFENRLETPPEDITEEVSDESDVHQVFFTGSAFDSALRHEYADTDSNGLPVGLTSKLVAVPGSGDLVVTLRHMPPINDRPVKTACAAMQVQTGGFDAIGGTSDASVTFPVTVQ